MHEASTRSPSRNSLPTVAKLEESSSPLGDFEHALDEPRLTWAVDTGSEVRALSTFDLWYALNTGALAGSVRVWRLGREAWTSALDVPELACALRVSSASLPGIAEPRSTLDYAVIPPAFAEVSGGSVPEIPSALLLSPEELQTRAEAPCAREPSCVGADFLLESEQPAACVTPHDSIARSGGFGVGGPTPYDPLRGTPPPSLDIAARSGGFGVGGPTPHDPLRETTPPSLDIAARSGGFGVGGPTPYDPLRGTTPPSLDAEAEAPTMMPPLVLSSLNPAPAQAEAANSITPLPAFTPSDVPTAFELSTSVTSPPPPSITPTWKVRAKERRSPTRSTVAIAFAAAVSLGAVIALAGVSRKGPQASPAALAAGVDTTEAVEIEPTPAPAPEPSIAAPAPEAPSASPAEPVTPSATVAAAEAPKPRPAARPGGKPAKAAAGAHKRGKSFTPTKKGQQRARQGSR